MRPTASYKHRRTDVTIRAIMPSLKSTVLVVLSATANLVAAWPTVPKYAQLVNRADQVSDEYDYVIVGGGTSGLTVGDRLTENGKYTVLVIEEGEFHDVTGFDFSRMYNITSLPSPALNDRSFFVGIGKGVGGSSLVNGQVWLRGTIPEYDAWRTLGGSKAKDWDWNGLLPYFKKAMTLNPPTDEQVENYKILYDQSYWGDGEIQVSFSDGPASEQTMILYEAMSKVDGMTTPVDSGSGHAGLYWYPMAQDNVNYMRSYARTGHWDDLTRANYQMITGSKVSNIVFGHDMTATGVTFRTGSDSAILMLSGIGPADHLAEAGIDAKVNLPGVGANFQDHSYIPFIGYAWGIPPNDEEPYYGPGSGPGAHPNLAAMMGLPVITPDKYQEIAAKYAAQGAADFLPSHYTAEQIEGYRQQQLIYAELMESDNVVFNEMMLSGPGGSVQNLHPCSRGDIRLNTQDPESEVMVEIVKFMRRFMTTGDLAQYAAVEFLPGPEVATDEDLLGWVKENLIPSVFHPVGTTAKMPRKWGGVVDEDLFVYGTKKLRIIDSGIQPTLIGATTCETVYAVAEKIAEKILAKAGHGAKKN
ncbi:unnamed protein product [Parascedosporium putredinis]|uniref:Glucose-methanol-choline oxidoreductase N-terminal domain-containing protein n=1 Tax=Parascedosporium putredinis TaxID=1442378 RepID=A0A9P1H6I7_9PEZI|nr:unnamed protein product [Parascedosporium putredinis]CAI7998741.1 unnamed protein product [Parascedosporium putredinis]